MHWLINWWPGNVEQILLFLDTSSITLSSIGESDPLGFSIFNRIMIGT